jgi:hypothetical protein
MEAIIDFEDRAQRVIVEFGGFSDGTNGANGESAYEVWLGLGNVGTESDFIIAISGNGTNGTNGESAYQVWLNNGNTGTSADFLASLVGPQGPQGLVGPAGPQGSAGPAGITGPTGLNGAAATISVGSTTTLDEGADANVVNVGTSSAAIFNFEIPMGPTGPQGQKGDIGLTGIDGPTGSQGLQGAPGLNINIKDAVTAVIDLPTTGNTLNDCRLVSATGDWYYYNGSLPWINVGHIQGPQGIQGIQGIVGPTGSIGATGASATVQIGTVLTLSSGATAYVTNVGTSSAAVFNIGIPMGPQGPQGPQGLQGIQGIKGNTGNQGLPGTTGATGSTGSQGVKGDTGLAGAQGIQGIQGIAGPSGTLDTTNTVSLATNASEALSGHIDLNKIAKTGDYNDLINKPSHTSTFYSGNDLSSLLLWPSTYDIVMECDVPSSGTTDNIAVFQFGESSIPTTILSTWDQIDVSTTTGNNYNLYRFVTNGDPAVSNIDITLNAGITVQQNIDAYNSNISDINEFVVIDYGDPDAIVVTNTTSYLIEEPGAVFAYGSFPLRPNRFYLVEAMISITSNKTTPEHDFSVAKCLLRFWTDAAGDVKSLNVDNQYAYSDDINGISIESHAGKIVIFAAFISGDLYSGARVVGVARLKVNDLPIG